MLLNWFYFLGRQIDLLRMTYSHPIQSYSPTLTLQSHTRSDFLKSSELSSGIIQLHKYIRRAPFDDHPTIQFMSSHFIQFRKIQKTFAR